jgi:hypothetical protein
MAQEGRQATNTHSQRVIYSCVAAVVTAMVLSSVESWSQEQPPSVSVVTVGSKIRLLAPSFLDGRLQGLVTGMDEKVLLVSADGRPPTKVPRQAIDRLEVSTGHHRQVVKGMFIGAGLGAAVIGPVYHASANQSQCDNALVPCTTSVAAAEAIGIVAGAAWGAGIGALFTADRWREVPLGDVRVSLAPARGRGFTWALSVGS